MVEKIPKGALGSFDNIMFSADYLFSTNQMGVDFLNATELPGEQVEKIAHENADKLLNLTG